MKMSNSFDLATCRIYCNSSRNIIISFLAFVIISFGPCLRAASQNIKDEKSDMDSTSKATGIDLKPKFSFTQYTDLQGFDNDKPNGVLQEEFRFLWPTNGKSINGKGNFYLFRSVTFPTILLNRIDKSKKSRDYPVGKTIPRNPASKDSMLPYLTTMDIFKYSNLQIGGNVVLLAYKASNTLLQLQYGFSLLRNKPYYGDTIKSGVDSGRVADDFRPVYTFQNKFELNVQSSIKDYDFNIAASAGVMLINMRDNYYKQFDASVVDPFNQNTSLLPANDAFIKRKPKPIWYFSGVLEKKFGEEDQNNVFFRVNYYYQTGKFNRLRGKYEPPRPPLFYEDRFHNHFLQLQFGVTLGVERLFKKDGDEKKNESQQSQPPKEIEMRSLL